MKGNMKKTLLAVVVAGMGVVNFAHADPGFDVKTMANASADVTFAASPSISNKLTAQSHLLAGAHHDGDVIADGIIHSENGSAGNFVIAFTDSATWVSPTDARQAVVKGENTSNPLTVGLMLKHSTGFLVGGVYYPVLFDTRTGGVHKTGTYRVGVVGDQNVIADTYKISTSAYVYTE